MLTPSKVVTRVALPLYAATLLLALLTACASAGFAPPKSFDQQLAYAYGTHTSVLNAAASSVETGALSVEDAQQVLRLADESRALLDAARLASSVGDVQTAEGRLLLATQLLQQLLDYVNRSKP